jgi:membrane protein YqaA with SNARE-associated domain
LGTVLSAFTDISLWQFALVAAIAFFASIVGGVSGYGSGALMPLVLVPQANIRDAAAVADKMYVDLGQLRAFKGSQRYPVPAGIDLKNYPSVVIWCERFGVLISPADLNSAS